jgi:phage N-6-adenine-methyltransferase
VNAPTRTGPSVARGKSKQDYETPRDFIEAVEKRFRRIDLDLAATAANAKAEYYFGPDHPDLEARDGLVVNWRKQRGLLWLNPPFGNIEAWAVKCAAEAQHRPGLTLLLTPASIGTDWFREHVCGKAVVLGLSPRLTFVGEKDPYPKDLMLSVFGYGLAGFGTWRWKP